MLANPLALPTPSATAAEPPTQNKVVDNDKSFDAPSLDDKAGAEDDFDSELNALLTDAQQAQAEIESQSELESPADDLVNSVSGDAVETPLQTLELLGISPNETTNQLDSAGRTAATTPVDVKPVADGNNSPVVPSLDATLQSVPQSTEATTSVEPGTLDPTLSAQATSEQSAGEASDLNLPTPSGLAAENGSPNSEGLETPEAIDVDAALEGSPEAASDAGNESTLDSGTSQDFATDSGQSNTTDLGKDSKASPSLASLLDEVGSADKASQDTSFNGLNSATANRNSPTGSVQSAHRVESPAFSDLATRNVAETQLADHVVQARHQIENGRAELEVQLDPPELGKITIELTETKDSLTAKILVAERSTLESMRENTNSILDSLASEGVALDHLQLEASEREQQDTEEDHYESLPQSDTQTQSPIRTTSANSSSGIDILV